MIDALSAPDSLEDAGLLIDMVGGNQDGNGLADCLRRGVAEHGLGAPIPGHDDAVQALADDGIIRRFDDRSQPTEANLRIHSCPIEISH